MIAASNMDVWLVSTHIPNILQNQLRKTRFHKIRFLKINVLYLNSAFLKLVEVVILVPAVWKSVHIPLLEKTVSIFAVVNLQPVIPKRGAKVKDNVSVY